MNLDHNFDVFAIACLWLNQILIHILPSAEVPRDLDIVPLPPGPFYIKIELFFIQQFFNVY